MRFLLLVAGAGFAPASGGYAYQLQLSLLAIDLWSGLYHHPVIHAGCLLSSLYTLPPSLSLEKSDGGLGSVLPFCPLT